MRGRPGPRRAVVELARIGAHVVGQLLERLRGHVCSDHREQRGVGEQRDRIERGQRVETEILEHVRRHRIDGCRPEQQGVAVRGGAYHLARAYGAVGARLAFHDEALAELRFDPGGYRPKYGLRNASRGEGDDHTNGLAGPVLGEADLRPERKQPGGEECQNLSHERILYWEERCPERSSAFCSSARETSAVRRPPRRFLESWLPTQAWQRRFWAIRPAPPGTMVGDPPRPGARKRGGNAGSLSRGA